MIFSNFEFVKEYPTVISGKLPVRIYKSYDDNKYRWHVGFKEDFVKPLCSLLECAPYWGEMHWKEEDGFWIWWTMTVTDDEELPFGQLQRDLNFRMSSLNKVLDFFRKAVKGD